MADIRPVYREARSLEADQLAAMRLAMRLEGGEEAPAEQGRFLAECAAFYERTIADPAFSHWVAAIGEALCGTISLHRVQMIPRPCRIEDRFGCIVNNYVMPDFRGRGIAGELLQRVTAAAEAEELELIIVWPSERAVPFYARAGFQWENEVMERRLRDYVR